MDPVRFEQDLKVTMQALGWSAPVPAATCRSRTTSRRWRTGTRRSRTRAFPALPSKDELEIN